MTTIATPNGQGPPGPPSVSATTAAFAIPPADGTTQVTVYAGNVSFLFAGVAIAMQGAGAVAGTTGTLVVAVAPVVGATTVQLVNNGTTGNAAPGTVVPIGSVFAPGGVPGAPGAPGATGASSYTTTTATFLMPAQDGATTVAATVVSSGWAAVGETIFVATAGYLLVNAKPDTTHLTLVNPVGIAGNASPGTTIASGVLCSPAGPQGVIGPTGATGSGTSLSGPPATVTASATLPNGTFVRRNIDCTQATQITITLGAAPTLGDIYCLKLVGATIAQPVLFSGGAKNIEDPNLPGVTTATTAQSAIQGDGIWWQYNGTAWDIIARA